MSVVDDDRDPPDDGSGGLGFVPDARDAREASPPGSAGDGRPAPGPAVPPPAAGAEPAPPRPVDDLTATSVVRAARASGNRWWAAIVLLLLVVVGGSLLTLYNGRSGSPAVGPGDRLPPFAAPLATAPKLEHDAVNYAAEGDQGDAGRVPACSIDDPSVVTSCALLERGPLVLLMFAAGVDECVAAVDALDRLGDRYPRIQRLAVAIGGQHDKTARTVRERRWSLPVAYDRDGGLSARIGSPTCPFALLVDADGMVRQRLFGTVTAADLERGMRDLERAAPAPPTTPNGPTGR